MSREALALICLGVLAVTVNWTAHSIVIGTAKPTPLTVHICDQGSNEPLSGILIYYSLAVAREPHVLGIPTMQTASVVRHTLRAYSDSTGCATFDAGETPLRIWEYQNYELVFVNLDVVRMEQMSDVIGPNTNYEPNPDYQGAKIIIPRTMRDQSRKEQQGDGWELQIANAEESDAAVLTVYLRRHSTGTSELEADSHR